MGLGGHRVLLRGQSHFLSLDLLSHAVEVRSERLTPVLVHLLPSASSPNRMSLISQSPGLHNGHSVMTLQRIGKAAAVGWLQITSMGAKRCTPGMHLARAHGSRGASHTGRIGGLRTGPWLGYRTRASGCHPWDPRSSSEWIDT